MTELPTRTLGRTGLNVTTLGYGSGGLDALEDEAAERLLNAVLDAGINFVDTSIDYGRAEELIGRFISQRRSEFFLASKCGCVPAESGGGHLHTAANIRAGVEHSLRLLKTDYLDLVQFHRSLTGAQLNEQGALAEVLKLRDEGKVRFVGSSVTLPEMPEQIAMGVFDAFQVPYSAVQRDHAARPVIPRGLHPRDIPGQIQPMRAVLCHIRCVRLLTEGNVPQHPADDR